MTGVDPQPSGNLLSSPMVLLMSLLCLLYPLQSTAAVLGALSIQSRSGEPLYAVMDLFDVDSGKVTVELVEGEDPALTTVSAGTMITGGRMAKLVLTTSQPVEAERLTAKLRFHLPDGSVLIRAFNHPLRPRLRELEP